MIRLKLIEALSRHEDWSVVSEDKLVRSDGLWVIHNDGFYIGSSHHSVPQAELDYDDELRLAWHTCAQVGMGKPRSRRPVLDMLGVPEEIGL